MAFRISEFKSQLDWFGGPARGSLFEVQITPPRGISSRVSSRDLTFFCKNATIPGITFNTVQNDQTAQFRKMMPMGVQTEPVQAIFMLDSDHQVLSFFHSWAQNVVQFGTGAGSFAEVDGKLPFEIGYKDHYGCRIVIRQYSVNYEQSGQYYEVILDNAFPLQMGDVDLAWENNDSISVLPVSFQYDRIQVTGERIGSPSARYGRGNGLLGLINQLGSVGQLIGQDLVPTSIQDAVNKYTNVNNKVRRINDFFG
jgi:hypothetical protein|tara:strand:- start:218 stop:979 length:762 start_codon:yes stop_codon:yes gene_type:complete